jgi:hypothetical protein
MSRYPRAESLRQEFCDLSCPVSTVEQAVLLTENECEVREHCSSDHVVYHLWLLTSEVALHVLVVSYLFVFCYGLYSLSMCAFITVLNLRLKTVRLVTFTFRCVWF